MATDWISLFIWKFELDRFLPVTTPTGLVNHYFQQESTTWGKYRDNYKEGQSGRVKACGSI
jgi:hypothetical protein